MEAKDLAAQALRYNNGKRQWNLIDFKSLEPMVKVLEFGSIKYLPDNWKKGMPREQILNSAMRHLTAMLDGEEIDSESGLPHSAHVACNMMFLSYFEQGLGSEKAMGNYKKDDSIKQYPVTIEEAEKARNLGDVLEDIRLGVPLEEEQGQLLTAPEGYVFVDREQYQKVRHINDLGERIYDYATQSWYLNDSSKTDWVCNLLTNEKGLVAIPMDYYLNYIEHATT